MIATGASRHGLTGKAWETGGIADRAPRKRLLASFVQQRPAGAAHPCGLCPGHWPGRRFSPVHAQSRAGRNREEPMTTTIILLTINSIAQLIAAVAQLIAALRRGP